MQIARDKTSKSGDPKDQGSLLKVLGYNYTIDAAVIYTF